MVEAQKHKAMISCSIALSEGDAPEKQLDCGLIKGHAYAITDIRKMSLSSGLMSILGRRSGNLMMLKLRNPWGKKEWNGAWSDQYAISYTAHTSRTTQSLYTLCNVIYSINDFYFVGWCTQYI
jgi:hypothetical protein